MKYDFINLKLNYLGHQDEYNKMFQKIAQSAKFIGGEEIINLENNLKEFVGVNYAIGVSSGTDALLTSLLAFDFPEGYEIITTPFTFIATAEVISLLKLVPVFVDINEDTYNIDVNKIEEKITDKTKAIIPVHLYGQSCEIDTIVDIAKKYNLKVIEDSCQSTGSKYKDKMTSSWGDVGATSFFPSKPLGCFGDGGMVFTNNEDIFNKIKMIMNHGQNARYKHKYIGINGRLDNLQAGVLNIKFKDFIKNVDLREKKGKYYSEKLKDVVITPKISDNRNHIYAQYSIRVNNRESFLSQMAEKGIPTAVHYPMSLHLQEAFKYLGYKQGDFPISEEISDEIVSLPFYPEIEYGDIDEIIESIKNIVL